MCVCVQLPESIDRFFFGYFRVLYSFPLFIGPFYYYSDKTSIQCAYRAIYFSRIFYIYCPFFLIFFHFHYYLLFIIRMHTHRINISKNKLKHTTHQSTTIVQQNTTHDHHHYKEKAMKMANKIKKSKAAAIDLIVFLRFSVFFVVVRLIQFNSFRSFFLCVHLCVW